MNERPASMLLPSKEIRRICQEQDISPSELARESGVPQTICWNVLRNRRYRCGEATLERLTAYLLPLATAKATAKDGKTT